MRADRLLSMLILMQTRGRMTARALADELEVSERTVYRDVEALSQAGVPVYTERGPGGGCALLESYRTNLTGLNASEAQAFFMLNVPGPLSQLGVGQDLKAALLKLSAALPAAHRQEEKRSRQRIHLDSAGWFQPEEALPCLPTIQRALWRDQLMRIIYWMEFGARLEEEIAPYGLVAKTNVWYLVAAARQGDMRVYRVAAIEEAEPLGKSFTRTADFELADFWKAWSDDFEHSRPEYPVTVRLSPALAANLPHTFGAQLGGAPDDQGWVRLTLSFETLEAARDRLLGLGGAVEVLEPLPLRLVMKDFAAQINQRYS